MTPSCLYLASPTAPFLLPYRRCCGTGRVITAAFSIQSWLSPSSPGTGSQEDGRGRNAARFAVPPLPHRLLQLTNKTRGHRTN